MKKEQKPKETTQQSSLLDKLMLIIPIVYVLGVSVYMIWHRAWLSPDQFFGFAILGAVFLGRTKQFLRDWIPVLLLLFGYEYLRGLVPYLSRDVNIFPMIQADLALFGYLPTFKLQGALFTDGIYHWYDYMAVTLYIAHFVIPMVVAFILWLYDRAYFKLYTACFLLVSYMAFITYLIYPAMPPWMASNLGYIPPLKKIMDQVLGSFAHPIDVPSVYRFFGANLVAAIPSVHSAYPWIIFLFMVNRYPWFAIPSFLYSIGIWFSVVYLGEHYAIDVVFGFLYACIAFAVVYFVDKRIIIKKIPSITKTKTAYVQ
jgi:hypothetical protein